MKCLFFLCMLVLSPSIMAMIIFVSAHRDCDYSCGTSGKEKSGHGGGYGGGGGGGRCGGGGGAT